MYVLGTHVVQAFDKESGALLWVTSLTYPGGPPGSQGYGTAVAAGRLVVGDVDVFGLDPTTGAVVWRFAPSLVFPHERAFQRLTTDGITVYCGGVWGNVYAVDAASGNQKWVSHVTTLPDSTIRVFNPVVNNGVVYVAFDDTPPGTLEIDGGVAAFDAASGRLLWSTYLPHHFGGKDTENENVTLTGNRVVAGGDDGFLYGLDRQSGEIRDTISQTVFGFAAGTTEATIFALATADSTVLVGTYNSKVVAFDARNLQRVLWQTTLPASILDLVADSTQVYVDYGGALFGVLRLTDGATIWSYEGSGNTIAEFFAAAPALDADRIFLGSDQHVYAFKKN